MAQHTVADDVVGLSRLSLLVEIHDLLVHFADNLVANHAKNALRVNCRASHRERLE